jgi:spermidine/putrescine transport system permease protein
MTTDTMETADTGSAAPDPGSAPARKRRMRTPKFLLALPAWTWFILFFALPVGLVLLYSLGEQVSTFIQKPDVSPSVWSLDNFDKAIDPAYMPIFWRTLKIAITGTFICLLVSLPFSYWLATKVNPKWRGLLLGLVLVPFWTNFLVRTIGWQLILSPNGVVSSTLQDIGITNSDLALLYTQTGVQIGVVYNYLPLMILPLYVAFERIDPALTEASKDLGANRVKTFVQVTMPLAMPGAVAGMLLVFIPLMGDYITPALLGGAKGSMAGILVAEQFLATFNWSLGAAMAVIMIGFILGALVVFSILGLLLRSALRARRRIKLPEVSGA